MKKHKETIAVNQSFCNELILVGVCKDMHVYVHELGDMYYSPIFGCMECVRTKTCVILGTFKKKDLKVMVEIVDFLQEPNWD